MRYFLLVSFLSLKLVTHAQTEKDTSHSAALPSFTDSLPSDAEWLADLMTIVDSLQGRTSFFSVSAGIGNRLFSLRNNNFNAQQITSNRLAFTPALSYVHKSGLGATAVAYMSEVEGSPRFYQYAFSPSYDYFRSRKFSAGLSYTYYLTSEQKEFYATPFRHELYAYLQSRKGWLRPGFSAGWASGSFREITQFDTVIFNRPIRVKDTSNTELQDLSFMGSLSHVFSFDKIFLKNDALSIVPQVMLVAGAQQYDTDSKTTVVSARRLGRSIRRYYNNESGSTGFRLQSAAFSLNTTWFAGNFSASAGYFLSYYVPESEDKLTHIFSLMVGWTF